MKPRCPPPHVVSLCCLVLLQNGSLGQSLSIARESGQGVLVEATVPPDSRYGLQASANLHLWMDIQEELHGKVAYRLDESAARQRFFRLRSWAAPAAPITVVLIGDSTAADFANNSYWFHGWGQGLYGRFKANANLLNLALPGYSSKVFLASAEREKMLLLRPDFVLIAFGLIDAFTPNDIGKTTTKEFEDNLKTIVQSIRGFNGTPILVTQIAMRFFDEQDRIVPVYQDRPAAVRAVAAATQTYLIDLHQLSLDLLNQLGKKGSDYIWWGNEFLHFSEQGAKVIAGLVVDSLPDNLGAYLVDVLPQPRGSSTRTSADTTYVSRIEGGVPQPAR